MMVARFFMCERRVSNLIYYSVFVLFILLFRSVASRWLQTVYCIDIFMCKRKVSNFSCINKIAV